jgi:hypothetical protein
MAETVAPGTARHLCPLECGWHYDEPPPTLADTAGIAPDPAALDAGAAMRSILERAALRSADVVESAVREHVATHGIHTVAELRAAVAACRPDPVSAGVAYPADEGLLGLASLPVPSEMTRVAGCTCGGLDWHRQDCGLFALPAEQVAGAVDAAHQRLRVYTADLNRRLQTALAATQPEEH